MAARLKHCARCSDDKPIKEFLRRSDKPHLRHSWCNPCLSKYKRYQDRWVHLAANLRRRDPNRAAPPAKQLRHELGEPNTCYLCGDAITWEVAELDHVIPLSQGGQTVISNLHWTHKRCNRIKHNLSAAQFVELLRKILNHIGITESP